MVTLMIVTTRSSTGAAKISDVMDVALALVGSACKSGRLDKGRRSTSPIKIRDSDRKRRFNSALSLPFVAVPESPHFLLSYLPKSIGSVFFVINLGRNCDKTCHCIRFCNPFPHGTAAIES